MTCIARKSWSAFNSHHNSYQGHDHTYFFASTIKYHIAGNLRWVKVIGPWSVFSGLIFVVCPEHVIIVAYYLDFRWCFRALRNENKTQWKFPAIRSYVAFCWYRSIYSCTWCKSTVNLENKLLSVWQQMTSYWAASCIENLEYVESRSWCVYIVVTVKCTSSFLAALSTIASLIV